jgi:hypothetical protein
MIVFFMALSLAEKHVASRPPFDRSSRVRQEGLNQDQRRAWSVSEPLIKELRAADGRVRPGSVM